PDKLSQGQFDEYLNLTRSRERLRRRPPTSMAQALCVTEFPRGPMATHVLLRGNPHAEADLVEPGFPTVLAPPNPSYTEISGGGTCGRRLALANWIASKENP